MSEPHEHVPRWYKLSSTTAEGNRIDYELKSWLYPASKVLTWEFRRLAEPLVRHQTNVNLSRVCRDLGTAWRPFLHALCADPSRHLIPSKRSEQEHVRKGLEPIAEHLAPLVRDEASVTMHGAVVGLLAEISGRKLQKVRHLARGMLRALLGLSLSSARAAELNWDTVWSPDIARACALATSDGLACVHVPTPPSKPAPGERFAIELSDRMSALFTTSLICEASRRGLSALVDFVAKAACEDCGGYGETNPIKQSHMQGRTHYDQSGPDFCRSGNAPTCARNRHVCRRNV